jgi:hypothetical protein
MRKRIQIVVILAAVVAAVSQVGCASPLPSATSAHSPTTEAGEARTYVNSEYGFSVTYPPEFVERGMPTGSILGPVDFMVAFFDGSMADEVGVGKAMTSTVTVGVVKGPSSISKTQERQYLKVFQDSCDAVAAHPEAAGAEYTTMKVLDSRIKRIRGRRCFVMEYTYQSDKQTLQHRMMRVFIAGDRAFMVNLEATDSRWQNDLPTLTAIADSLEVE